MNLSPESISALLYGFPEFAGARPVSVDPADTPLFRVKIIPFGLGVELKNDDPSEVFFHIELFANASPPRAELWNAQAWHESLTKRFRHKRAEEREDKVTPLVADAACVRAELARIFVGSRGISIVTAQHAAEMLVYGEADQAEEIIELLGLQGTVEHMIRGIRDRLANALVIEAIAAESSNETSENNEHS